MILAACFPLSWLLKTRLSRGLRSPNVPKTKEVDVDLASIILTPTPIQEAQTYIQNIFSILLLQRTHVAREPRQPTSRTKDL
ncbi:hypothetical protein GGS20DRAFT_540033 [Poronia punctata]|nr:hypothetical protein GGS20DRAFT_540033 [Poronia punctata]